MLLFFMLIRAYLLMHCRNTVSRMIRIAPFHSRNPAEHSQIALRAYLLMHRGARQGQMTQCASTWSSDFCELSDAVHHFEYVFSLAVDVDADAFSDLF